jgi:hypothetical protein
VNVLDLTSTRVMLATPADRAALSGFWPVAVSFAGATQALVPEAVEEALDVLHLQCVKSLASQARYQVKPHSTFIPARGGWLEVGDVGSQPVRQVVADLPCPIRKRDAALGTRLQFDELAVCLVPGVTVYVLALAAAVDRERVCLLCPAAITLALVDRPSTVGVKVFPVIPSWTTLVLSDRFMTLREPQVVRSVRKVSDSHPVMILKTLISFDTVAAGLVAPTTKVANGRGLLRNTANIAVAAMVLAGSTLAASPAHADIKPLLPVICDNDEVTTSFTTVTADRTLTHVRYFSVPAGGSLEWRKA